MGGGRGGDSIRKKQRLHKIYDINNNPFVIIKALTIISERGVSALPVVDDSGAVVNVYSKRDVMVGWIVGFVYVRRHNTRYDTIV